MFVCFANLNNVLLVSLRLLCVSVRVWEIVCTYKIPTRRFYHCNLVVEPDPILHTGIRVLIVPSPTHFFFEESLLLLSIETIVMTFSAFFLLVFLCFYLSPLLSLFHMCM